MKRCLVAPLNWGLGHASRCVPLVQRFLDEGNEVVLGGDGESLTLLRKHFPTLRYVYLAPLNLRYSNSSSQVFAILRALPKLLAWSLKDHALLKAVMREEPFDCIVSDNRFGLWLKRPSSVKSVYMTHQLHILFPRGWKWLESLAERLHARLGKRFDEVWVPDYEDKENSLSGELGHPAKLSKDKRQRTNIQYIGPLSRFRSPATYDTHPGPSYDVVAVLSGLEPQRTMLEQEIVGRYAGGTEQVLIVQGLMHRPNTRMRRGNITLIPYLDDDGMASALLGARHIIARSGYSTLMDLHALGLLKQKGVPTPNIELIPTPGQPEQEYLAQLWNS